MKIRKISICNLGEPFLDKLVSSLLVRDFSIKHPESGVASGYSSDGTRIEVDIDVDMDFSRIRELCSGIQLWRNSGVDIFISWENCISGIDIFFDGHDSFSAAHLAEICAGAAMGLAFSEGVEVVISANAID